MATLRDKDDAPRLLCRKFSGEKGPAFTKWRKEFLDAAEAKGDQDASWAMCYLGLDPQAGLNATQTGRRSMRRRETYGALIVHQEDESLKDTLRAEGNRNGRDAWLVLERECAEPILSLIHI